MDKPKVVPIRGADGDIRKLLESLGNDIEHVSSILGVVQRHDGSFMFIDVGMRDPMATHGMLSALALDLLSEGIGE